MKTLNFITDINCGGCVSAVTPTLNQLVGEENWVVDTSNPDKILTVFTENVDAKEIILKMEELGYEIKPIINN